MNGLRLSSLSSWPQLPPIMLFLTTMPSLTLGFMWKAMSRDLLTMKLMLILPRQFEMHLFALTYCMRYVLSVDVLL